MGHQGRLAVVAVVSFQATQSQHGPVSETKQADDSSNFVCDNFIQGSVSSQRADEGFLTDLDSNTFIVQELCESRGCRPGMSVLTSLLASVDVKIY